jgi:hypothetical protein
MIAFLISPAAGCVLLSNHTFQPTFLIVQAIHFNLWESNRVLWLTALFLFLSRPHDPKATTTSSNHPHTSKPEQGLTAFINQKDCDFDPR